MEELNNEEIQKPVDTEEPLDKNIRMMSPTRMVVRRFFRSRLSIIGLVMVVGLFLFSYLGPLVYSAWGETELDNSGMIQYSTSETTYTVDDVEYTLHQTTEKQIKDNLLSPPSGSHPLGTDYQGYDVLARLMYGGKFEIYDGETLETIKPEYDIPNMYLKEDKAFFDSIDDGIKNRNNIDNILESMKLLDRLYESAKISHEIDCQA